MICSNFLMMQVLMTQNSRSHSLQVHEYSKYMTYTIWHHLTDGAEGEEEEDTER